MSSLIGWRGKAPNWSELFFVVERDLVLDISWPARNTSGEKKINSGLHQT
jgi:hypothetical protein